MKKAVEKMTKMELFVYAKSLEREKAPTTEEMLKRLSKAGIVTNLSGWHDLRKNPDDLPQPVKLNEFEDYDPLVLVFFYRYDDYGKAAKVYGLDRWNGSPFNRWERFTKDKIIAWHELPPFEDDEIK